ncbi:protein translocase subunit SecF [Candidatus Shapirobacteria bacterium CG07_land_8_20_14_0_80_39_12]|uniref:Protein-export membrane protein SecF n=4 Tax=Microgenomates group TaxID=1794810 RepID=A0A2M6YPJ0_9BACT|nr:MAG: protein translocase subunit SecF [Candidatus Shapirobacteria bacterium CG07_land_8_20_14_0_80_39_12]PJA49483.1 MAG: protein translocase subunit SecF [Candidatus Shapirobacteria bacterium CG_4_9_14_3_um_filter_39_13]
MIRWMRFKWLYFLISAIVIVPGLVSLLMFGLRPAIDFTGGTLLEYRFDQEITSQQINDFLKEKDFEVYSIQSSGERTYLLRLPILEKEKILEIENLLTEKTGSKPQEVRFEVVGPTLGRELLIKTIIAVILAAGFILSYVAWRFKNTKFGVCAILALFHDILVLLGAFSLMGHFWKLEVDTLFVTAMLTILSLSVYDTIVVYDRIRESQKLLPDIPFESVVNKAITETLPRSLNTSLTLVFVLVALILLGGVTIKWFAVALLIGAISGTYSSPFNAVPLLVLWENLSQRRKK